MDPYPTHCSARFGVDPDYRSGSRASQSTVLGGPGTESAPVSVIG